MVNIYRADRFEWDDENKKNGNVQHLRQHGIQPEEAEECFFHNYDYCKDERRFDDVYILDGRGITTVSAPDGGAKRTFEWQSHSMFLLPRYARHQFSNTQGNRPAQTLSGS